MQGFECGYKHKGAWDARPQSSINVLIEESLRSPHSPEGECVEYVTSRENAVVRDIIKQHNNLMSRQQLIRPTDGTDFCLVGKAVTFYLQKYFAGITGHSDWASATIAARGASSLGVDALPKFASELGSSLEQEAFKCLLLAAAAILLG